MPNADLTIIFVLVEYTPKISDTIDVVVARPAFCYFEKITIALGIISFNHEGWTIWDSLVSKKDILNRSFPSGRIGK